jgi:hypothetical protein
MSEVKIHPVTIELEKYKAAGANMLIASTEIMGLSDLHKPVVDKVILSPDPAKGDVYKGTKDNELLLTGHAIEKLSIAAGIVWDALNTRRTDPHNNNLYISFQAVGGIKKTDGTPIYMIGHYDIDFEIIIEELEEQYKKKAAQPYKGKTKTAQEQKEYVDFCVKRDTLFKRKHKMALCETGAKNRVLRKILCLKGSYTREELSKPFVVVRVAFAPNFNDPAIRRQLVSASIQSTTDIYGGAPAAKEPEIIDAVPADEEQGKEPEVDPADEFKNGDEKSQVRMLETLVKKKGYNIKPKLEEIGITQISELSEKNKLQLFEKMQTLQDDDIPW